MSSRRQRNTGCAELLMRRRAGQFIEARSSFRHARLILLNRFAPYGLSKLSAENYAHWFHCSRGLDTVTLRFGNVYGERQDPVHRAPDIAAWLRGVAGLLIWSFIPFPVPLGLLRHHISAIIDERFAAAGGGGVMAPVPAPPPPAPPPPAPAGVPPGGGAGRGPGGPAGGGGVPDAWVRNVLGRARRAADGVPAGRAPAGTSGSTGAGSAGTDSAGTEPAGTDAGAEPEVLPVLPDPVPRGGDRALARFGLLGEGAAPAFTPGARYPLAGRLLALPPLAQCGLLA